MEMMKEIVPAAVLRKIINIPESFLADEYEIVITPVETTKGKYASLADKLCGIIPDNGQDYKELVQEVIEDKI